MAGALFRALDNNAAYSQIRSLVHNFPSELLKSDQNGRTVLHKAVMNNNLPEINLFLAWGADPNAKDSLGYTPLHYAVSFGYFNIIKTLLYENAWVDTKANNGKTPLHLLSLIGKDFKLTRNIAELLLRYGADPDAKDSLKKTPVVYATMRRNFDLVNCLCGL